MATQLPDTVYDSSVNYKWMNANDRVAWQRAFETETNPVEQRMAQAMIVANPDTPDKEIRDNMTAQPQPRFGVEVTQLTITDILGQNIPDPADRSQQWNDFSGTNGQYEGTARPGIFY
jgi:hypothetical protein